LRQGLRELGYVEGKNLALEARFTDGRPERYPELAAELVRLKPDVIVVASTGFVQALKRATTTIPIVAGNAGDLVQTGLVASLARPGGNITGSTDMAPDLVGKRLELLREVVPKLSRLAVLHQPLMPGLSDELEFNAIQSAARPFGIEVQAHVVKEPAEFEGVYAAMTRQRPDALIIIQGSFTLFHHAQLARLAGRNRLPAISEEAAWAQAGCLLSYAPDKIHSWGRAAQFVGRIIKGAKPGDLPIEQPTKFELVVNLKTAKALGITIPQSILVRADKVID